MRVLDKFIFFLMFSQSNCFLTKTEEKIFFTIMKRSYVRDCLIVPHEISVGNAVEMTKTLSEINVFTAFLKSEQLERILQKADVYRWTVIILKEKSLKSLKYFDNKNKIPSYYWILFDESKGLIREELIKVEIPFDTALIMIEKTSGNNYILNEYYSIKKLTPGIVQKYGEYSNNSLKFSQTHWYDRKSNMHGYEFITVKFNEDLYLNPKDRINEIIWQDLSVILNFTISNKFIDYYSNSDDFNAEEDDALLDTQIYIGKNDARRYLLGPTSQSGLYMYIKSEGEYKGFKRFLKPFLKYTWIFIGFWSCFCGIIEFVLEYFSKKFKLNSKTHYESYQAIFMPFYFLCNQCGVDISNNISLRISLLVIRLSSVVFFYFYSATFLSCLLLYIPQIPFTNLKDFITDGRYKLIGEKNSDIDTFFNISTDPLEKLVHENFLSDVRKWSRLDVAVERMCKGEKLVVVAFDDEIDENKPCKMVKIKPPLKIFANGFKIRYRSPFRGLLHVKLLLLRNTGILQRLINQIQNSKKNTITIKNGYETNLEKVSSIFILLFHGILLAVIILMIEIVHSKLKNRKKCLKLKGIKLKRKRNFLCKIKSYESEKCVKLFRRRSQLGNGNSRVDGIN